MRGPAPGQHPADPFLAEALGTAALLAVVVGSGIMAERLAGGNGALALLANSLATGAGLTVLILVLGPVSGAHFNPAVTGLAWWLGEISPARALAYLGAQVAGAVAGVLLAHAMFAESLVQLSARHRWGPGLWLAELVATAGLLGVVRLGARQGLGVVAPAVGLYIGAAYWFTASTAFANPAVTLARALTDTFAGIGPASVPAFLAAQAGALALVALALRLRARTFTSQASCGTVPPPAPEEAGRD